MEGLRDPSSRAPPVHCQKNHGLHLDGSAVSQLADFFRLKHLQPVLFLFLGAVQPHTLFCGLVELLPETNRLFNQLAVIGKSEQHSGERYRPADGMKAPGLADLLTVRGEVLRPAIAHKSLLAEMFDDLGAPRVIIPEGTRAEFSGFSQHPLGVQEFVCQFRHPQTGVVCFRRNSPGLQIFTKSEIFPPPQNLDRPKRRRSIACREFSCTTARFDGQKAGNPRAAYPVSGDSLTFLKPLAGCRCGCRPSICNEEYQCGAVAQSVRAANS